METKRDVTRTKGDVIVEDIKIGDVQYEFEYGCCIKSTVISLPVKSDNGDGDVYWSWENKRDNGVIVNYGVSKKHAHYGPNLYTYMAYDGCTMI